MTFPQGLLALPLVEQPYLRRFIAPAAITLGMLLMVRGSLLSKNQPTILISLMYVTLSIITLPLWFAIEPRYILILLPGIILTAARAMASMSLRVKTFSLAVFGFAYLWSDIGLLHEATSADRGPVHTMQWIRENTHTEDIFLSQIAAVVYLDTRRKCDDIFIAKDMPTFTRRIHQLRTSYILTSDEGVVADNDRPGLAVRQLNRWIRDSGECRLVFADPSEQTKLYQVATGDVITSSSSR
jgi:hypothetical protein